MKKSIGIVAVLIFLLMTGCSTAKPVVQEPSSSEYKITETNPTAQAESALEIDFPAGEAESSTTHTGSTTPERQEPESTGKPLDSSTAAPSANLPQQDGTASSQTAPSIPSTNRPTEPEKPAAVPPAKKEPSVTSTPAAPTIPSAPAESTTPPQPTEPTYTQADYDRIIRETVAYAESYREKGFMFVWDESLEFGWESGVGWMGTPRIKYEGIDGTISRLRKHVDKIVKTNTNPAYGVTSDRMTYKVVQITVDGDIAFAVIYGG